MTEPMTDDHFDTPDTHDPDMGRWCHTCQLARHADCRPHGCQAERDQ